MKIRILSRRQRCVLSAVAGVCLGAAAHADISWNTTSGNWSSTSNWTPAREPTSSDTVLISVGSSTGYTVTLDTAGSFSTLELGNSAGTVNLSQASGFNLSGATEEVGLNGVKGTHSQSNGTNTLSQALMIGFGTNVFNMAGTGTYTIKGGTIHVTSTGSGGSTPKGEYIGDQATGRLSQSGGTNTVDSALYIGTESGGVGTYSESGGVATVGLSNNSNNMYLGYSANTTGTYTISNSASMTVHGGIYVGGTSSVSEGTGTLNVNGGTLSCTSNLDVWENGTLTMTAGSLTTGNLVAVAGGILNLNGGTINAASLTDSYDSNINISGAAVTTGLVTVSAVTTLNLNSGSLAASGGISVSGNLNGSGTTTASVTVNSGGNINPSGTLTFGGLTTTSGAILTFAPGDQITTTASNGVNLAGTTTLAINVGTGTFPLINYVGSVSGSLSNLVGPASTSEESFNIVNNTSLHQIQLVARKIGTEQTLGIEQGAVPGGGTFTGFGEDADSELADDLTVPVLNNAGQVTFNAKYLSTSNNYTNGIFRWSNGALGLIAADGSSAPGGGTFDAVDTNPSLNDSGTVVFGAGMTGASDGAINGLFTSNGTTLSSAARQLQLANGGGQYADEGGESINSGGQVVFAAGLSGPPADGATSGIFSSLGLALARENHAAPGGGTFTDLTDNFPSVNASGQVAILAGISGVSTANEGIYLMTSTSQTLIARPAQGAPGGGKLGGIGGGPSLNASGQIAFSAVITGATDQATIGLFRSDSSGNLTALVRATPSFPNYASLAAFTNVAMNDAGQVTFEAETASYSNSDLAIYRADSSLSLVTIATQNTVTSDGQYIQDFFANTMNAGGTVAFFAILASTPSGTTTNQAICLGNGTNTLVAIEDGQSMAGSTVAGLEQYFSENNYGQIAYTAYLADGRAGNFLFTPAIHWVAGSGGSWDTSTNWTAGISPGAVHDVYLDPTTPQTITGPASAVIVNSLTIGGNGGAVTFNMNGGILTVTGALTVASDGSSINVARGTINLPIFTNVGIMALSGTSTFAGSSSNSGTFTAGGVQNWPLGSTFTNTAGSATFNSDPGISSYFPLAIAADGGSVTFSSSQHLAGLSISAGASAVLGSASTGRIPPVLVTNSLTFGGGTDAWQGLLDLTSYSMIVHGGDPVAITDQIKEGMNADGGYWNGSAGIVSSSAAADTRLLTALGWRPGGIVFGGENTAVSDVLVKYTYYGDADLNGTVNGADYQQIDNGFGSGATGWFNGDFNYDGVVDGSDYSLIDNTFNQIAATGASPLALVAPDAVSGAVPEPATLGLLALGIGGAFVRRRRNA